MARWWKASAENGWGSAMPGPARDPSGESSPKKARSTSPKKARSTVEIPEEADWLIELLLRFKSNKCSDFVYRWMDLPKKTRKVYSYNGAIRCQDDSDPKHYFCDKGQQHYFDPTNWVYALAMRMMLPHMMKEVEWNNETKGDIFESIMGCHYMVSHGCPVNTMTSLERNIGPVAAIFEAFAWGAHRLCRSIGHHDPELIVRWATWIIDMVAYRQRRDEAIGTIVLDDDLDTYDFNLVEPRIKCHALRRI